MYVLDIYKDAEFREAALISQVHGAGSPDIVMKCKEIDEIIMHISNEEAENASEVAGLIQASFKQIHGKELYEQ